MSERGDRNYPPELQPIRDILDTDNLELANYPEERGKRKKLLKRLVFSYRMAVLHGRVEEAEPVYTQFQAESEDLLTEMQLDHLKEVIETVDKAIFGGKATP